MATTYKVLGQSYPTAATATSLYTVPSSTTTTIVSTINICNLSTNADKFRIAIRPAGAALANEHYIAYDITLPGKAQYSMQAGLTLNYSTAGDVVTIYSQNGTSSFSAFGSEIA